MLWRAVFRGYQEEQVKVLSETITPEEETYLVKIKKERYRITIYKERMGSCIVFAENVPCLGKFFEIYEDGEIYEQSCPEFSGERVNYNRSRDHYLYEPMHLTIDLYQARLAKSARSGTSLDL